MHGPISLTRREALAAATYAATAVALSGLTGAAENSLSRSIPAVPGKLAVVPLDHDRGDARGFGRRGEIPDRGGGAKASCGAGDRRAADGLHPQHGPGRMPPPLPPVCRLPRPSMLLQASRASSGAWSELQRLQM